MSYDPTNWKTGDVVTSAKLNKLEQGVAAGSGVLVVHSNYDETSGTEVLDKTAFEIFSASSDGKVVISAFNSGGQMIVTSFLSYVSANPVTGWAAFKFIDIAPDGQIEVTTYTAGTQDDYPVLDS